MVRACPQFSSAGYILRSKTELSRAFISNITFPVTRETPVFTESGFVVEP